MTTTDTALRRCTKCKTTKPVTEFYLTPAGNPRGACKECTKSRVAEYGKAPQADGRSYHAHKSQRTRERKKRAAVDAYGGECSCCHVTDLVFLTIDHVDGGGRKHRESLPKGSTVFYQWLADQGFPERFQVLCWNCNSAKHILGECPHQSR